MTKAVILAAGKSMRTYPLTITVPKPLLNISNKPILQHNLDQLQGIVNEAIIIVGYKKDLIINHFKNSYKKIKLTYISQESQWGTGNALLQAQDSLKKSKGFIVLMGDDLYNKEDIKKLLKHQYSVLTKEVDNPSIFGVFTLNKNLVVNLIEKPQNPISNYANCALYHLDNNIFKILEKLKKTKRNEYELTDAINILSKNNKVYAVKTNYWYPIGYPWDLFNTSIILAGKNSVSKTSKINGKIENSIIGKHCKINGVVRNSLIMDNVVVEKGSIIENSIIGNNVIISGKVLHDDTFKLIANNIPLSSGNFGVIIGDNVEALKVNIKPGTKIWPNLIVSGDLEGEYNE